MRKHGWLVVATLALAGVARADAVTDAKAHFKAGTAAYKRADYQKAIAEFRAAYKARPAGVLQYNIAQCYEKLGDIPSALAAYHAYLRETPAAEDRATVEAAMGNLERRLQAKGVQELLVYSDPPAAKVSVDGQVRGATPLPVEVEPGAHDVKLELPGYFPTSKRVTVTPEKSVELDVALQADDGKHRPQPEVPPAVATQPTPQPTLTTPPVVLAPEPNPAAARPAPAPEKHRTYTWIAAGTAVAAAGGGVLFGLSANGSANDLRDGLHDHATNQSLHDSAHGKAVTANVLYGVAGVAAAAAVTLFFVEGSF